MMQRVFVVDANRAPLMPCHPARARTLLRSGQAAVLRHQPFTIILRARIGGETQPLDCKVDPGSQATGLAVAARFKRGLVLVWAAVLFHRGEQIHKALVARTAVRRNRRARHTRYRPARFDNRARAEGWLPPSLMSRLNNVMTWTQRLRRWCPVSRLAQETVKFDTQLMQNADISGVEYQQGTLAGYEVREYLLERWQRRCAYCGRNDLPLQIEHLIPRSRGGSNRVTNLTLACEHCNIRKGNRTADEFGYPDLHQQAGQSLKDAAAVNATRRALYCQLSRLGLVVHSGSGGQTKFNRTQQGYPKNHWIDAACVGEQGHAVRITSTHCPLHIKAEGRQNRQMCRMDKYGFPRTSAKQRRVIDGFQTGDLVQAVVPATYKAWGTYCGRLAVRASRFFSLTTATGQSMGSIPAHCCRRLQTADGYTYLKGTLAHSSHE